MWGQEAVRLLESSCLQCHGAAAMGGVDLRTREGVLKTGAERMLAAVRHTGKVKMPPGRKLSDAEITVLADWLVQGASMAAGAAKAGPVWWAFQKPVRPQVPRMNVPVEPVLQPVDAFVYAAMAKQGLMPNQAAPRETLIKRAYYDLHGLPPSAEEVAAFVNDTKADAFARLVDRLLASPRYGEKWGRFWLDVVRYSDTAGFEADPYVADAWRYRDWVIKSFNDDKPYNRFVKEQIAGDELWPDNIDAKTGTGFYCVGPNRDINPEQAEINREEVLTDFVDTTGAAFLGLGLGCARCHDHKYDPIPRKEYFGLRAIFEPALKTKYPLSFLPGLGYDFAENRKEILWQELGDQIEKAQGRCRKQLTDAKLAPLGPEVRVAFETPELERTAEMQMVFESNRRRVSVSQDEIRACMDAKDRAHLERIEKTLVGQFAGYKPKPYVCGITDVSREAPHTYMPQNGERFAVRVEPTLLSAVGGGAIAAPPVEATTTHRRKALAEWIGSAEHPLTARVMVNRIWQQHFGRGLAGLASDFGARGGKPSHPELLDWLATEFVASGWSMKAMHRTMMNTDAYQRAAQPREEVLAKDPQNTWLTYYSRRRLTAEEIRDSMLAAAGALNLKAGGRPVVPPLTKAEMYNFTKNASELWIQTEDESEHLRRSVYMFQRRTFRLPLMDVFDAPEPMLSCARREESVSAPQSLTLLNSEFTMQMARRLGGELAAKYADDEQLVRHAFRRALAREPGFEEMRLALALFAKQRAATGTREGAAVELARGMMNLNEFLYVD
jgi:hypothetical protein